MFKNVAAKFMVYAFDSTTGLPKTGDAANLTAYVSKDYGAVTVLADTSATEMDSTNAKGYYLFDAAQGETNGDCLMVSGKSSTSNIVVIGAPAIIYTRPTTGWLAPTTAGRTLDVSAGGEAGVDWANVGSPTTSLALTGTTIAITQQVDINTIKTQAVTCGAGVTVGAFVGNATAAIGVTAAGRVDLGLWLGVAPLALSSQQVQAIVPAAQDVNVKTINGVSTSAVTTVKAVQGLTTADTIATYTGNTLQTADVAALITTVGAAGVGLTAVTANATKIAGSTNAASNLSRGTLATVLGTVGSASSTTSIVTSALDPAAAVIDQFKGRIVTFDRATTTANLRGQATDITGNTALGVLTVTALTDAPVSGDTFTVT